MAAGYIRETDKWVKSGSRAWGSDWIRCRHGSGKLCFRSDRSNITRIAGCAGHHGSRIVLNLKLIAVGSTARPGSLMAKIAIGRYRRAPHWFNRAKSNRNRANGYNAKGNPDPAIENYTRAVDVDPRLKSAHNNRGNAYSANNDLDRPSRIIGECSGRPNFVGPSNFRIPSKERPRPAFAYYNKALETQPASAFSYSNRGNVYRAKGDHDHASSILTARSRSTRNTGTPTAIAAMSKRLKPDVTAGPTWVQERAALCTDR
jgi:tetratricopeptide (TPR) repeat protein